jgi:hypothetical protein
VATQDARDELRRRTHEALQGIRGRSPTEPPVEPIAQAAWALETNGGRRHPLDVVISGSLHPPLKIRGFKRKGRTWNRRLGGVVHVINLQASAFNVLTQHSPCLYFVNIGVFIPEVQELVDREPADGVIPEYRCHIRHRLNDLTGDRSQLFMSLEQDRTLEQQGEEMSRLILDVGVAYLDRFTSLEAFYAIGRDEAGRDPLSANKWALVYAGVRTGDRPRAEIEFRQMVNSMWPDTTWRPKLERMASALDLPLTPPGPKPAPTPNGYRAGMEVLKKAMLAEIGGDWQPNGTNSGTNTWPRHASRFQREFGTWQLECELTHFADAEMAEAHLPVRTPELGGFETVDGLGDSAGRRHLVTGHFGAFGLIPALTYAFRVGPVNCSIQIYGWGKAEDGERRPIATLLPAETECRRICQLQLERVRVTVAGTSPTLPLQTPAAPETIASVDAPLVKVYRNATSWRLELADCAGLRDDDDVQRAIERLCELGLAPTLGSMEWQGGRPQPIDDARAWMDHTYRETDLWKRWKDSRRKLGRATTTETWSSPAVRPGLNWPTVQLGIARYGRDNWHLTVWATQSNHGQAGVPLEEYATTWADLLQRIAEDLRPSLRPALAILYASESYTDSVEDLERGALLVGWRTWYGPRLIERFGRDFLLGLPDQTKMLNDGTIAHELDVPASQMVLPSRSKFGRLRAYVHDHSVEVAFPRL